MFLSLKTNRKHLFGHITAGMKVTGVDFRFNSGLFQVFEAGLFFTVIDHHGNP